VHRIALYNHRKNPWLLAFFSLTKNQSEVHNLFSKTELHSGFTGGESAAKKKNESGHHYFYKPTTRNFFFQKTIFMFFSKSLVFQKRI
jgi:hypothetical protein